MPKSRPTERADLAWGDLTSEEQAEVVQAFDRVFQAKWESRMFFTRWTDGKWSACVTRPLWAKGTK